MALFAPLDVESSVNLVRPESVRMTKWLDVLDRLNDLSVDVMMVHKVDHEADQIPIPGSIEVKVDGHYTVHVMTIKVTILTFVDTTYVIHINALYRSNIEVVTKLLTIGRNSETENLQKIFIKILYLYSFQLIQNLFS